MKIIINYIFVGFILTFLLDYISDKFKNHPSFKDVPEWDWGSRIIFMLFWPLGTFIFIYSFIKERFKQ